MLTRNQKQAESIYESMVFGSKEDLAGNGEGEMMKYIVISASPLDKNDFKLT